MATKTVKKEGKGSPKKNKTRPAKRAANATVPHVAEKREPKKREPRMAHKQIWLIYAQVILARNAEDVFDLLGRTFETHNDLGYWLYRIGHSDLKALRKGNDWVDYIRLVATRLFRLTRDEPI